ncbi:MAG: hypothetical protein GXY08_12895 [Ruminococcus sp.]|nr:hypothetical protein [Ruminococcus sp.]
MRYMKLAALLVSAALCTGGVTSCGSKKSSSKTYGEWELITPEAGAVDENLGSYRIDPETGIKLYYEEEDFPRELVITLEKHFLAFQNKDFESFKEQNHPIYNEEMEKFLQKGYHYGLKESFEKHADSISSSLGGSFEVTRVKVEPSQRFASPEEGVQDFFTFMNETFENEDFEKKVRDDCDEFYYFTFYVMAKDAEGNEQIIVSDEENNAIYAEKDGKYYTFG